MLHSRVTSIAALTSKLADYRDPPFRSSEDLVHRLFVCIAGVADQLQTNFASDLRNILKCVFLMNSSQMMEEDDGPKDPNSASANQSADSPGDMVETESIHERHEPLPEYEDVEETALTHDRGTKYSFASFSSRSSESCKLNVAISISNKIMRFLF